MNYGLSPELEAIRETARQFARDRLLPAYQQSGSEACCNRTILREMGRLGCIGANTPERLGGTATGYLTQGIICEAVAAGDFNYADVP